MPLDGPFAERFAGLETLLGRIPDWRRRGSLLQPAKHREHTTIHTDQLRRLGNERSGRVASSVHHQYDREMAAGWKDAPTRPHLSPERSHERDRPRLSHTCG